MITDKMIDDIAICLHKGARNKDEVRKLLNEMEYEVEEKKSKLDELLSYIPVSDENHISYATLEHDLHSMKTLAKQAIEEIQEQHKKEMYLSEMKVDAYKYKNIPQHLIDWLKQVDKECNQDLFKKGETDQRGVIYATYGVLANELLNIIWK